MTTKWKLLQNYREILMRELGQIDTEIDELDGRGPDYPEDEIGDWVDVQLSIYRDDYDESDLYNEIGSEVMRLRAAYAIDEEKDNG